ncbi:hypothetical protein [Amorphus orientalis]|uniref:Endonuclease III n=1 Tax=Amorphus orientalis TaxID=649198 RepID=A0AAE4AQV5_9HYPH|nr:hypothetical protein [Amorphus orientalis]MDQ0313573.1 endonuclease III [Amorphus orientalis]
MSSDAKDRKAQARRFISGARTYSEELGLDLSRNTPSPLFRWLVASLLFSTRISADLAMSAAEALSRQGWTTPQKMKAATWEDRTRVLNEAGYARYDESTSERLEDLSDKLIRDYGGDLRKLREKADGDPATERRLLKEFKGIGDTGVDIFCREAQLAWPELHPYVDRKSLESARKLGLAETGEDLAKLVDRETFPRLLAALVRADLSKQNRS